MLGSRLEGLIYGPLMDGHCLSDHGDALDIYWWIRRRVVEVLILERIVGYAKPPGCPILCYFAAGRIPRALCEDHDELYLLDGSDYDGSPWDDGGVDEPFDTREWFVPVDNSAELAALFALLSDDEEAEEEGEAPAA